VYLLAEGEFVASPDLNAGDDVSGIDVDHGSDLSGRQRNCANQQRRRQKQFHAACVGNPKPTGKGLMAGYLVSGGVLLAFTGVAGGIATGLWQARWRKRSWGDDP